MAPASNAVPTPLAVNVFVVSIPVDHKKYTQYRFIPPLILLAIFASLLWWITTSTSQTTDETAHLGAGAEYLTTGSYFLNPEHPPFMKILFAGSVYVFTDAKFDDSHPAYLAQDQWWMGYTFIYENKDDYRSILNAGRLPTAIVSIVLAIVLWSYSKRRFGNKAAMGTLILVIFSPIILAHGTLMTTDVPAALAFFCALWAISNFIKKPTTSTGLVAAFFVSFAQVVKYNLILLYPTLLFTLAWVWWQTPREHQKERLHIYFSQIIATTCLSFTVILISYQFDAPSVSAYTGFSKELLLSIQTSPADPLIQWLLETGQFIRIPGLAYLIGLGDVIRHNHAGHFAYILGMTGNKGWWYYFPFAFMVKSSLIEVMITLFFLACGLRDFLFDKLTDSKTKFPNTMLPFLIGGGLYIVSSLTSGINIGVRHLLPLYPFVFVGGGYFLARYGTSTKKTVGIFIIFAALHVLPTLWYMPWMLSYFNILGLGPSNGPTLLSDSNADWGQGYEALRTYLSEQQITDFTILASGTTPMIHYGINPTLSPFPKDSEINQIVLPSYAIVTVADLYVHRDSYQWLRAYRPIGTVAQTYRIYHLHR